MRTKKLATLVAILFFSFLISSKVYSQEVSGGIKGGLTMSNLYIDADDLDDENARFGFHAGFFSQIMFFETLGIQPEILFTTKGTEAIYEAIYSGLFDQTVKFNLSYIEIPALLMFRPVEILEFYAGPYAGIMLGSNIEFSGLIDGEDEIDRDNFNTFDYGIAAGLAMNFGNVKAGLRYNIGMWKLAKTDLTNSLLGDSKNAYGQLYIAFRITEK
ncbi:MAG: porin family protein [Bacteroidales bacterium]